MRAPPEPETCATIARRAIAVFERDPAATPTSPTPGSSWASPSSPPATGARSSQALQRAREHARRLRRHCGAQIEAWNEVGGAMLFGRTPVDEVLAFLDEELAWARERGLAAVEADALLGGPYLYSRLGRFDEARDRLERSKAICRELGIAYGLAEAHMAGAEMEMLAGDADAAERELRDAIDVATRWARRGTSRSTAPSSPTSSSRRAGTRMRSPSSSRPGRSTATPPWKSARARVLARRGETEEAVALAREAAAMADSDDLTARAETLTDLAEVLRAHGDAAGAAEALAEAIGLHEEKGNVLNAERCRDLLATIEAEGRRRRLVEAPQPIHTGMIREWARRRSSSRRPASFARGCGTITPTPRRYGLGSTRRQPAGGR